MSLCDGTGFGWCCGACAAWNNQDDAYARGVADERARSEVATTSLIEAAVKAAMAAGEAMERARVVEFLTEESDRNRSNGDTDAGLAILDCVRVFENGEHVGPVTSDGGNNAG